MLVLIQSLASASLLSPEMSLWPDQECVPVHVTHMALSFPLTERGWGGHKTGKEAKVTEEQNLVSCRRAVCFGETPAGTARACCTYIEYLLWGQGHGT